MIMAIKNIKTNDQMIRNSFLRILENKHKNDKKVRIIEELGINHGDGRVDIAVINDIMHGYEIKSDRDTLKRLPKQVKLYNSVFNKITLIVSKNHLYNAIKIVPDYWGIILVKTDKKNKLIFQTIRKEELNKQQDKLSVARLLWKQEAIKILEEKNEAKGFYSKNKENIYYKLLNVLDKKSLNQKVRETIFYRLDWRLESPLLLSDD